MVHLLRRTVIWAFLSAVVAASAPSAALGASTPIVGKNAELVTQLPEAAGAVAMKFSVDRPLMVLSTLKGIHTYDISDPRRPERVGVLPMVIEQNEGMSLVERRDGTKYVLIGSNLLTAGLVDGDRAIADRIAATTSNRRLLVVEITDPARPSLISFVDTPTRTHTVSCATLSCEYAYTDGRAGGAISIVDLRDMRNPKVAGQFASVVPSGHDQDVDEAGILWHVGAQGTVALDVSDPMVPVQLNATDGNGLPSTDYKGRPWNNFIHHNSYRPNADDFEDEVRDADGNLVRLDSGPADIDRGNVLLVTEEDYVNTTRDGVGRCGDYEGSFQTWRVPWLDAGEYAGRIAGKTGAQRYGQGTIEPLDRWNTELLDSGTTPAGAFCSAHYFDYDRGFVAQGWYQQGTRILDVRDPRDIKQVGYFFTGAMETWASYFVPRKWAKKETLVYTADAVRGVDVLDVTLPKGKPKKTREVRAPVLRSWVERKRGLSQRESADWGYLCPLAPRYQ